MLKRMFGVGKGGGAPPPSSSGGGAPGGAARKGPRSAVETAANLQQTIETLEKKQALMDKKVDLEAKKAREYMKNKNKEKALQCLKRKKMYEKQSTNLANFQMRMHEQLMATENVQIQRETVAAMKSSAVDMKAMQADTNADLVAETMDDMREVMAESEAINEALGEDLGTDVADEDDLQAELEEMEAAEMDAQLMAGVEDAVSMPSLPSVPSGVPAQAATADEDAELAELMAEMAAV